MRLTCPNCSAQYEVPDEVIPEEGRDVQCSACDQTWFQAKYPADETPEAAGVETTELKAKLSELETSTPEEEDDTGRDRSPVEEAFSDQETEVAKTETKTSGNIDPSVADILQEEAARESELRAQEGSSLETQPDLALDVAPIPKVEPKTPTASETSQDAGQKEALPDVETINSSMLAEDPDAAQPARKSGGFVRGFALVLIIAVILYLIYGNAQQISEVVPQADPVLKPYVSLIDQARIWLEAQAGSGASQN